MSRHHPQNLETVWIEDLPEEAVPAVEAAFERACRSVALFLNEETDTWRVEGVREEGTKDDDLTAALALASLTTGLDLTPQRAPVESEGWLARTAQSFPEQAIGGRVVIRPTHLPDRKLWGRTVLKLDAGIAFGSGEHASTQGCLIAFEGVARRMAKLPKDRLRMLDLGAGSGILAMAAASALHRRVLATDIEPWSVRVANGNAGMNGLRTQVRSILADGWKNPAVSKGSYDLVFANILARPLCAMAGDMARHLRPGGTAILAGLLGKQANWVLAAHRRGGLVLERRLNIGPWTTLVLRKRG
ncbi:50S ribosomal protein L11 methyltransferase [Pararoseomonas sp. SCSIO 73927]|uniref:50S ribosomal protein L11 methyltransferase n=1 Tax=Pararoseomonas sp. SCSIO 73927 TaxID=3114537 RepID=UPI0030CE33FD